MAGDGNEISDFRPVVGFPLVNFLGGSLQWLREMIFGLLFCVMLARRVIFCQGMGCRCFARRLGFR